MAIIKPITPEETWSIRHQVLWPNQPIEFVKIPNDDEGLHFGCFINDKLVSVISGFLIEADQEAQFRKFATLPDEQGKGYGSQLLSYLMNELETHAINRIWCNARVNATTLYERFGMRKTDQTFIKLGYEYVVMEKWLKQ